MALETYDLDFDGYWLEKKKSGVPDKSGIYGVYTCKYHESDNTVSLKRLIYIGEAANVKNRIGSHEKWKNWQNELKSGQQICFNFAPISPAKREQAEAAMIYEHKPVCNSEYTDRFPYDTTTVNTSGKKRKMTKQFTVYRTK